MNAPSLPPQGRSVTPIVLQACVVAWPLAVAAAEDVVLAKLEWARLKGSQGQHEDAVGILLARAGTLDRDGIERRDPELGVADEWAEVRRCSELVPPGRGGSSP